VLPWYRRDGLRLGGAALLAGLVLGGLVTFALSDKSTPPAALPEQSVAEAIAGDQAASPTATPTAAPKAAKQPAAKPAKRRTARKAPRSSGAVAAEPTATATPEDEELGDATPATPRGQAVPRKVVAKLRTVITPQRKAAKSPASTPQPAAPAPAPTESAPQPAATATPAPTKPPKPPKPEPPGPPGGGGGGDDDPGPGD
jgi:hypothetical protein